MRILGPALVLFILCAAHGRAQNFNFQTQREPVISLDGKWRFHTGDDPRWADPNFDDSGWSLLRSDQTWGMQGYKGYSGVAWYRFRVQHVGNQPVALLLPYIDNSYQVFASDRLLGTFGTMPPHPARSKSQWKIFLIGGRRPSPQLSIAIRVWKDPKMGSGYGGPWGGSSFLGDPAAVADRYRGYKVTESWSYFDASIIGSLEALAGVAALCLYFIRRSDLEYLLYALTALFEAATRWFAISYRISQLSRFVGLWPEDLLGFTSEIFLILFVLRILEGRRTWLFWSLLASSLIAAVTTELSDLGAFRSPVVLWASLLTASLYAIWVVMTCWGASQRGSPEARLLFVPLLLDGVVTLAASIYLELLRLGLPIPQFVRLLGPGFNLGLLHLLPLRLTELFLLIAVVTILILRFARTRRNEQEHARELEAARSVQQVLLPEGTPSIPGFSFAAISPPAGQLSGDFLQIIPAGTGVLIALGNVGETGVPAAMTVGLLVGTMRTLAEEETRPGLILQGLNQVLLGRKSSTSCALVWLEADGHGWLATAGQLAPSSNGRQVETASQPSLGLNAEAKYVESPLTLAPDDTLTFVHDARSNTANMLPVLTVAYRPLVSVH